ncbi:MAG: hypothetical protein AAF518_07640 [Spirochaetota bacterium]
MEQPFRITKNYPAKEVLLTRRWFSRSDPALLVCMSSIAYFLYKNLNVFPANARLFILILFCICLLIVIGKVLINFVNRTHILLSPEKFSCWNEPFRMRPMIAIKRQSIYGVNVKETTHSYRYGLQRYKRVETFRYSVYLTLHSAEEVPLIENLSSYKTALFIEKEIKNFLGIEDETISPLEKLIENRKRFHKLITQFLLIFVLGFLPLSLLNLSIPYTLIIATLITSYLVYLMYQIFQIHAHMSKNTMNEFLNNSNENEVSPFENEITTRKRKK